MDFTNNINEQNEPNFEEQIALIVATFGISVQNILAEIEIYELLELTNGDVDKIIKKIDKHLEGTINDLDKQIEEIIPIVIAVGVISYMLSTKKITFKEVPTELPSFSRLQLDLVRRLKIELKNDFRGISLTMRRRTEQVLRQAVSQAIRNKYSKTPLDSKELKKIKERIRKEVKDSVNAGYIDKIGRVWKPETYARVVADTKVMTAYNNAIINESIKNGVDYGIISGPSSIDACANWIGKTVKLNPSAIGNYPTYESLKESKEIFHPFCRHWITPTQNNQENL